eukprot:723537-Rhodomonas_salina.1
MACRSRSRTALTLRAWTSRLSFPSPSEHPDRDRDLVDDIQNAADGDEDSDAVDEDHDQDGADEACDAAAAAAIANASSRTR